MKYIILLILLCFAVSCNRYPGFKLLRNGNPLEIAELTAMLESYGFKYKVTMDDRSIYIENNYYEFIERELQDTLYDETKIRKIHWPHHWISKFKREHPEDTIVITINDNTITVETCGKYFTGNQNRISGMQYFLKSLYKDYQIVLKINGRS